MIIDKIQKQENRFRDNFHWMKGKKIVLYGTGRRTKNILTKLTDYNIVGLLDGDSDNRGKKIEGISIIGIEEAEKLAEYIIINTSEIYWNIIYQRISTCKIPIYLENGVLAKDYYKTFSLKDLFAVCDTDIKKKIVCVLSHYLYKYKDRDMKISSWFEWGYIVWGVVIWSYLCWLYEETQKDECKKLLFLSRDGFLLMEAYKKFVKLIGAKDYPEPVYVVSSRRCTYAAGINATNFTEYCSYFFNGTFEEYMDIRFDIRISEEDLHRNELIELPKDISLLLEYIKPYKDRITYEIKKEKKYYKQYLKKLNITCDCGIIDTGYTGKVAECFSELLEQDNITAYYFYGNLSVENEFSKYIKSCFQIDSDLDGSNCNLYRYMFMVETVLSAPFGTAIKATNDGFVYEDRKEDFSLNWEIFNGIERFMEDITKEIKEINDCKTIALFVDKIFGYLMMHTTLSTVLQEKLHWDDTYSGGRSMMQYGMTNEDIMSK